MAGVGSNPHLKMRASVGGRSAALGWAFGLGRAPGLILDVAATSHLVRGTVILAGMRIIPTASVAGGAASDLAPQKRP